jgi:hypothetical protein
MEGEHRADALFALPRLPRRVSLFGDPPGWRRDLEERGIEVVDPGRSADLAVATEDRLTEAVATGAGAVIVEGSPGSVRILAAAGYRAARVLSLPLNGTPVLFVDLDRRGAARYALRRGIVHRELWRTTRNEAVAALVGAGIVPPFPAVVGVGSREPGPPALVSAARELGVPDDGGWVLLVSPGSVVRRNGLLVFPRGAAQPSHVLKFSRLREPSPTFEREEQGVARVAAAGGVVAARAPRYLGRIEADGFPAAVETAAPGTKLSTYLRRPLPRAAKLRPLEAVARWLVDVARETAGPPEVLGPDLPPVPPTFQHNDLAEENVVVRRGDFTVLDWEWADPTGLPLGDLLYFGVHVLAIVDGADESKADRERHFVDLLRGRAASSPVLFRWVRSLASELELPADAVGRLATLSWLRRSDLSRREHMRAEEVGGRPLDPSYPERVGRLWVETEGLGPGWSAWRQ